MAKDASAGTGSKLAAGLTLRFDDPSYVSIIVDVVCSFQHALFWIYTHEASVATPSKIFSAKTCH